MRDYWVILGRAYVIAAIIGIGIGTILAVGKFVSDGAMAVAFLVVAPFMVVTIVHLFCKWLGIK